MEKEYTASKRKAREAGSNLPPAFAGLITDKLEQLAREGAERMLAEMLELEVSEFLQRARYRRARTFRGHRNGHAPERTVGVGLGAIKVKMPRVSHVPKDVAPDGFQSQIVGRYQRISRTTQRLLSQLYLEGLSTGDFEPVFRALLGEKAPLSPSSVVRLKQEWQAEYDLWRRRPLDKHQYLYVWVDGVYLSAGPETEKMAILCVLGLREDGRKELLAMLPGYRESSESWAEVLRDLRQRGMKRPIMMIGDGALGIWAALREVWPQSRSPEATRLGEVQRCWMPSAPACGGTIGV